MSNRECLLAIRDKFWLYIYFFWKEKKVMKKVNRGDGTDSPIGYPSSSKLAGPDDVAEGGQAKWVPGVNHWPVEINACVCMLGWIRTTCGCLFIVFFFFYSNFTGGLLLFTRKKTVISLPIFPKIKWNKITEKVFQPLLKMNNIICWFDIDYLKNKKTFFFLWPKYFPRKTNLFFVFNFIYRHLRPVLIFLREMVFIIFFTHFFYVKISILVFLQLVFIFIFFTISFEQAQYEILMRLLVRIWQRINVRPLTNNIFFPFVGHYKITNFDSS